MEDQAVEDQAMEDQAAEVKERFAGSKPLAVISENVLKAIFNDLA